MLLRPLLACLLVAPMAAGADSHEPARNLVTLSASAKEDVASDLLVIQLFVEHEAREQAAAANQVNADMSWALATAKAINAVKAQTLDYRTHPVYDEQRVTGWRVHQALRLESADHGALTNLLGTLQQKLAIESVAYQISDSVRSAVTERLTAEAIKRFMARARKIADAFGRGGYTLVNVNIDSHGFTPPPMPYDGRALAMQAEVANPAIAPGQQALEVGITGTIELAAP